MTVKPDSSRLEPGVMLQQAAAQLQAGRLTEGAALCRQVLQLLPNQPDALHLLAKAALDSGQPDEAEKLFLASLAQAPRRPDILVNYGVFLRAQGRAGESQGRLRKAIKLEPKFVPGWYNLGLLLHASGELKEAARCASRVTELAPGYPPGWELLATIRQKRKDAAAAIAACREGLRHEPKAPRLHYSLAQLLRQEGDFAEAARAYEAARVHGFDTPDLYRNHAEAALEADDVDQALACATAGIERFPDHALLQRTSARLHWEAGAPGDPLAPLTQAARSNPGNSALWHTLAQLLNRLGREDESHAIVTEARSLGCPETPDLLQLDALASAHAGEPEEATATFARLIAAYPLHISSMLSFANHLLATGDPERAEKLCAEVLDQNPYDQLAWAYRGTAWQLLDDPREAWLMDYERMVKSAPVPPPEGYDSTQEFFLDVQAALEALHRTTAHPLEQSLRGGTQTNGHLFRLKDPILRVLETQIRHAICSLLAEFPEDPTHPFWGRRILDPSGDGIRFSGAWSVRLRSEGYHRNHMHPEGWISSALYVALPDVIGEGSGHAGQIQFGQPLDIALPPRRIVRPEVGTLVLFPSYMWHGTVPFTSQQPRITVAFDLVPQE
jgi:tetratricopeptide (TPR) repeat protein